MKKILNLLAVTMILLGCSSDGKLEPPLTGFNISDDRIQGFWYIDKVIQADGTIEDYIHSCPTARDKVDFQYNSIQLYRHFPNCDVSTNTRCTSFQTSGFSIYGATCNTIFVGTYSYSNTNNNPTLRLDYDEVQFFGYESNNFVNPKGLLFSRN